MLEIFRRAKARGTTVSTLISIVEGPIQNSRSAPPLDTDNAKYAVAVQVSSNSDGSDFNSNWSSTSFFSSLSAETSPKNSDYLDIGGSECSNIDLLEDLQGADDDQVRRQCSCKMIFGLVDKFFPKTSAALN